MQIAADLARRYADVIRKAFFVENIPIDQVILFGSRAKGHGSIHSDWDYLVITQKEEPYQNLRKAICRALEDLADEGVDSDILVHPVSKLPMIQKNIGLVSHSALEEGISV